MTKPLTGDVLRELSNTQRLNIGKGMFSLFCKENNVKPDKQAEKGFYKSSKDVYGQLYEEYNVYQYYQGKKEPYCLMISVMKNHYDKFYDYMKNLEDGQALCLFIFTDNLLRYRLKTSIKNNEIANVNNFGFSIRMFDQLILLSLEKSIYLGVKMKFDMDVDEYYFE